MGFQILASLLLYLLPVILSQDPTDVTVRINGSATIAETNNNYICATLDWWPREKCNYNQCTWGQSSVLDLDLDNPFLAKAIQAFSPLRIRVGGSLQDRVVYGVPNYGSPCLPFSEKADALFGFSRGCLNMTRWDDLNLLFQNSGAIMTFGLNALHGRHQIRRGIWGGPWNSSNARAFIEYTISKGYPVDSWEFGNELSGHGVGASVGVERYAKDVINLSAILDELYENSDRRPLLLAPGGFFEPQWYAQLLDLSGPGVVDTVTHHIYNLGGGDDPHIVSKITDPQYLSRVGDTFRDLKHTIKRHGPWASAWVGEAGGAYNGGSHLVSNKFLNSLWYLDQLGMASKYNTRVYCRQSLIGGHYGLLDKESLIPNPDYYSALLWHRLMGPGVLSTDIDGSSFLRAYAHCRKQKPGISLVLINLSKSARLSITVQNAIDTNLAEGANMSELREEYHLTAKDGNHLGQTMLLNGSPLELTEDGDIPDLNPLTVSISSPISVAPLSIAYVVFPNSEAPACT